MQPEANSYLLLHKRRKALIGSCCPSGNKQVIIQVHLYDHLCYQHSSSVCVITKISFWITTTNFYMEEEQNPLLQKATKPKQTMNKNATTAKVQLNT